MKAFDRKCVTVIALGTVLAASTARSETWSKTAVGTYGWNDAANWGGVSFPNATDAVGNITGDFTGDQTINLNQAITVGSLTTNDSGTGTDNAVTIAAGTSGSLAFSVTTGNATLVQSNTVATVISSGVAFNSDTTVSGTGGITLSGATSVASGKALSISNGGGATLSGPISGSGTITKSTTGSNVGLTLSADNSSFTGAWILSGNATNSRLFISADNNLGASGVGITFTNINQISFSVAGVTLASTRTFTVNTGATAVFTATTGGAGDTVNSKITGAGSVTSLGTSTTTLFLGNSANDFTGSLNLTGGGIVSFGTIANAGVASALGAGSSIFFGNNSGGGGSLVYTGAAASSDRALQVANTASTTTVKLFNNGTGALTMISTANLLTSTDPTLNTLVTNLTVGGTNAGANSFAQTINASVGTGLVNFFKQDAGTWRLANTANTYTGVTTIAASGGVLEVVKLANGGSNSSVGASANVATNLLIGNAGTLRYVGTGDSTNRLFTVNGTAATHSATIEASGSGAINFTNTGSVAWGTTNQTRTLKLGGTNTGTNTFSLQIADNGTGAVSIIKQDAGKWVFDNAKTYTGTTTVNGGILSLGAANVINNSATNAITLGGGTLQSAFSQSLGLVTLSLTAGTASTLDLSTAGTFVFADSHSATWGAGSTLSIVGTFTATSVKFGASNGGLGSGQLSQITINGQAAGIDASGYLTAIAVPEPSTYAFCAGILVLAGAVCRSRKRRG